MTKANNNGDNQINLQNNNNTEHLPDNNHDLSLKSLNLNDKDKTSASQSQRHSNKHDKPNSSYTKSYTRTRGRYQKPDNNNNNYSNNHSYNAASNSYHHHQQAASKHKQPKIDLTGINVEAFDIEKELNLEKDKFFVIKSFSAQDVYNSIIYKIWCSTEAGNVKLNDAFKEATENNGNVYLFFSVNGSGYFCGVAKMTSEVDFTWQPDPNLWSHSTKWKGKFNIKWLYVKNVPNRQLSYIKLENNENKPVTHSRDCQVVPAVNGVHVLKIIHYYHHYSSILDYPDDYE